MRASFLAYLFHPTIDWPRGAVQESQTRRSHPQSLTLLTDVFLAHPHVKFADFVRLGAGFKNMYSFPILDQYRPRNKHGEVFKTAFFWLTFQKTPRLRGTLLGNGCICSYHFEELWWGFNMSPWDPPPHAIRGRGAGKSDPYPPPPCPPGWGPPCPGGGSWGQTDPTGYGPLGAPHPPGPSGGPSLQTGTGGTPPRAGVTPFFVCKTSISPSPSVRFQRKHSDFEALTKLYKTRTFNIWVA